MVVGTAFHAAKMNISCRTFRDEAPYVRGNAYVISLSSVFLQWQSRLSVTTGNRYGDLDRLR